MKISVILMLFTFLLILSCTPRQAEQGTGMDIKLVFQKEITVPEIGCITGIVGNEAGYYVADWKENRVFMFDNDDEFVGVVGGSGRGPGEFLKLTDLTLDKHGNLYVSDQSMNQIQVFSGEGKFLQAVKTDFPVMGLAVRGDGNLIANCLAPDHAIYEIASDRSVANRFVELPQDKDVILHILKNVSRLHNYRDEVFRITYNSARIEKVGKEGIEDVYFEEELKDCREICYQISDGEAVIDRGSIVFSDIWITEDRAYLAGGGGRETGKIDHFLRIYSFPDWRLVAACWPEELEFSEEGYAIYVRQDKIYFAAINEDIIYQFKLEKTVRST